MALIGLRAAICLAAMVFTGVACGAGPRPNILLIVIDTARADRFSFNGYQRDTAPEIAALGEEGVVYTRACSPSPWTLPAHASLFTGLYPSRHGADSPRLRLDDSLPFLAERLRSAGYRTVGYTGNPWVGKEFNFHQGFDTYEEVWRKVRGTEGDMGAGLINLRLDRWLSWRADNPQARKQPFFIFINYFEPHLPYNPPEPERYRFLSPPIDMERVDRLRRFKHPEEIRQIFGEGSLEPDDFGILSDLYDGEIAYVDRRVGKVIGLLRRGGLLDRTIVAITSDHGEMLGEHGFMDHKLNVYEPLLKIPLVLRYPAAVSPGQRIDDPVMLQDLYPTLLGIAGVTASGADGAGAPEAMPLPGVSGLQRSRRGGAAGRALIAEYARPTEFLEVMRGILPGVDVSPWDRTLVAYRPGDEKLHWASDGRHRLFDVARDPGERTDLAADRPERVTTLAAEVETWLRRPGAIPPIALPPSTQDGP